MKKGQVKIILPLIASILIVLSMFGATFPASADNNLPSPTPSVSPSANPSAGTSPTPSPVVSPSATPSYSPTPSATPNTQECIATDVHGWFDPSTTTPVIGHFYNVSQNEDCSDTLWVLVYGTNEDPASPSFVDSQKYITTYEVNVVQGASDQVETFAAPSTDYCVLQYDLMDSPDHPEPPYLYTRDSISVKRDGCDTVITSPSPTPSDGGSDSSDDNSSNDNSSSGDTSAVLGATTLADTGVLSNIMLFALGFAAVLSGSWLSQKVNIRKRK